MPLAVLLLFCSEGDNVPDAMSLVSHLDDWLHLLDDAVSQNTATKKRHHQVYAGK